jgi:ribulose-5-phosphate 4-epimerase/fuculose-1-phosphate aldolase
MRRFRCACEGGLSWSDAVARGPADMGGGSAPPRSGGALDKSVLEELALASRILAGQGVFDAFGHISMRHPGASDRFLMSRSLAPALVTADDLMEFDLDSNACDARGRSAFFERFIHGQIYKARPDVQAVVHSHSPSVIPYGLVRTAPMRAMYHNSAFIAEGVPIFDIREKFGATDMLVGDNVKGVELARTLGSKCVCLMRAHGSVAVGPSLKVAVFRAIMTENNAKLQSQAIALGGPIAALDEEEGRLADQVNLNVVERPWALWKRQADA